MKVEELRIWGRNAQRAEQLALKATERGIRARAMSSVAEAACDADVVCTVTSSREPILKLSDVAKGAHVNAVGFGGPNVREISSDLVAAARIFIDSRDGAARESGNLLLAARDGALGSSPNLTLLCDVLAGRSPGRQQLQDITLFDSLGIAIEDIACAQLAYARAIERGIGSEINF